jgi:Asp/Glu/hydantoin racemase
MTRVAFIHALIDSLHPSHEALRNTWPEATPFDILDTSLSRDLAHAGELQSAMIQRFVRLGRYAASIEGEGGATAAILFTCSAFGPAIEAVKREVSIPVIGPAEAAFEEALSLGRRIGLLVSFGPSLEALENELRAIARQRDAPLELTTRLVNGALSASQRGDFTTHDRLVAATAAEMPELDVLILGQFSLGRAAATLARVEGRKVLTTPQSAVARLKALQGQVTSADPSRDPAAGSR